METTTYLAMRETTPCEAMRAMINSSAVAVMTFSLGGLGK
jgi:hypothetical protein